MAELRLEDCINAICPWSGNPVSANALTVYRGDVVGFCNPGCRDKFEKATNHFERHRSERRSERVEAEAHA